MEGAKAVGHGVKEGAEAVGHETKKVFTGEDTSTTRMKSTETNAEGSQTTAPSEPATRSRTTAPSQATSGETGDTAVPRTQGQAGNAFLLLAMSFLYSLSSVFRLWRLPERRNSSVVQEQSNNAPSRIDRVKASLQKWKGSPLCLESGFRKRFLVFSLRVDHSNCCRKSR
jgi:hypothetical protein